MIPGPIIIIECPICKTLYKNYTYESFNNFGATFWSDGKISGPMLPEIIYITKCVECKNYFWIDECRKVDSYKHNISEEKKYHELSKIGIKDYKKILKQHLIRTKNDEIYLRMCMWHSFNDKYRLKKTNNIEIPEYMKENLIGLFYFLENFYSPYEKIITIEIFRELKYFHYALMMVKNYHFNEYNETLSIQKELILNHDNSVSIINGNDNE